jgi:hypothetical protein
LLVRNAFYLLTHILLIGSIAAGSWTASIIPDAHSTVEATAGTLMFIDIPKHRQDLWKRFHPDNYPVWSYQRGEGDEYVLPPQKNLLLFPNDSFSCYSGGGYPISKEGRLKFSFRGRKVSEVSFQVTILISHLGAVYEFPRSPY